MAEQDQGSLLWKALRDKKVEEAIALLSNLSPQEVNWKDFSGRTPLHLACSHNLILPLRLLLQFDQLDLNPRDEDGFTPFDEACLQGYLEVINALLSDPRLAVPPLFPAAFFGREREVEDTVFVGGNPRVLNQVTRGGISALYLASMAAQVAVVRILLEFPKLDVNRLDEFGTSPLGVACSFGHLGVVELLGEDERVDLNGLNAPGDPPIYAACLKGHTDVVKYLARNPRINLNRKVASMHSPLWVAASKGNTYMVEAILAASPNIETWEVSGNFALSAAEMARANQFLEMAKLIEEYQQSPKRTQLFLKRKLLFDGSFNHQLLKCFNQD